MMDTERNLRHRALLALLLCAFLLATLFEIALIIPFVKDGKFMYRNIWIPWTVTLSVGVPVLAAWIVFWGLARNREWSRKAAMVIAAVVLVLVINDMTRLIIAGGGLLARDHVQFMKIKFSGDEVRRIIEALAAVLIAWSISVFYLALSYPDASRGSLDSSSGPDASRGSLDSSSGPDTAR